MLMLEFVRWWYGRGWAGALKRAERNLVTLADLFSISILLRTLFAPWKRIISYPGAGLEAHVRAFLDNLVSRFIGFLVRIMVLLAAGVMFIVVWLLSYIQVLLWPFLPIAGLGLVVWGLL
jgi:hypothetical protein